MANPRTRHKARALRRIVIEPRDIPGQQPPQRMNHHNRLRLAALRDREQYLGDLIARRRVAGKPISYEVAEHRALKWAIAIVVAWMSQE